MQVELKPAEMSQTLEYLEKEIVLQIQRLLESGCQVIGLVGVDAANVQKKFTRDMSKHPVLSVNCLAHSLNLLCIKFVSSNG